MGELMAAGRCVASAALPPLYGVRKQIDGDSGEMTLGPLHSPFDVVGRELHYRGLLTRGLVDSVEAGQDGWWDGVARYWGRTLGRFAMRDVPRVS